MSELKFTLQSVFCGKKIMKALSFITHCLFEFQVCFSESCLTQNGNNFASKLEVSFRVARDVLHLLS